ncbi:recombinase RecT [Chryseobacterium sp. KACC 21268]|nr:recombinase RecT [Chryseobacterium sp. KACC 21268]
MENQNTQVAENKSTQVAKVQKEITSQVLSKINTFQSTGELKLPNDYSPENALKSAMLELTETKNNAGKYALDFCTQESIANALLKMVVWGLSPMKKQCDFIMYGNKLSCDIEYTGNIALAKRFGGLKDITSNAVFKGDEFVFEVNPETGKKKLIKHSQTLESMGSKDVVGAYSILEMNDGSKYMEVMSMQQIKDAWNQGAMKGNSPAHKNFPDQMAIKTVINRACKPLIRTSNDAVLYSDDDGNGERTIDVVAENVKHDINTNANKEVLGFKDISDAEVVDEVVENGNDNNVATIPETVQETATEGPGF